MLYNVFHTVLNLINPNELNIDNVVFKLHYKLTSFLLAVCGILVSLTQFFGDPIQCYTSFKDDIPKEVLNTYCWMQQTFILTGSMHKTIGTQVAAPGVEKYTGKETRQFQQYYQWVNLFLFFQVVCFYMPRFAWKILEGGKIKKLVPDLKTLIDGSGDKDNTTIMFFERQGFGVQGEANTMDKSAIRLSLVDPSSGKTQLVVPKPETKSKIQKLAQYVFDNLGNHRLYTGEYFLCEISNFFNVLIHIFLTDTFLGGEFSSYGSQVINFLQHDYNMRFDPMVRVFPRVTKCIFNKFGPSGDVIHHDAMCILGINIINEKIFVVMWLWFIILAVVSGINVLYRIVWFLVEPVRFRTLLRFNSKVDQRKLRNISYKFSIGDWFFLKLLTNNMCSTKVGDLVNEIDKLVRGGPSTGTAVIDTIPKDTNHALPSAPFV